MPPEFKGKLELYIDRSKDSDAAYDMVKALNLPHEIHDGSGEWCPILYWKADQESMKFSFDRVFTMIYRLAGIYLADDPSEGISIFESRLKEIQESKI